VNALLRLVAKVEHVDHGHVDLLAVTMAAADALLHPLRVPRQIEIHQQRAKLQIDALGAGFCRNQNCLVIAAEGIDHSALHIGGS
jgi:hypothetical protein